MEFKHIAINICFLFVLSGCVVESGQLEPTIPDIENSSHIVEMSVTPSPLLSTTPVAPTPTATQLITTPIPTVTPPQLSLTNHIALTLEYGIFYEVSEDRYDLEPTIVNMPSNHRPPGKITYYLNKNDKNEHYIVDTDLNTKVFGSDLEHVIPLSWSSTGEYIAGALKGDDEYALIILDDNGNQSALLQPVIRRCFPKLTWADDQQNLFWVSGGNIVMSNGLGEQIAIWPDFPGDCDIGGLSYSSEKNVLLISIYIVPVESELYSLDLDTGEVIRLTDNDANDVYPIWAPDGTVFSYLSRASWGSDYVLHITDLESIGKDQMGISSIRGKVDWSPDSNRLFYTEKITTPNIFSYNGSCYYDRETNKSHCLEDRTYYFVDWAPYEEILVLHEKEGQYALYCFDVEENTMYQVTEYIDQEIMEPHWVP